MRSTASGKVIASRKFLKATKEGKVMQIAIYNLFYQYIKFKYTSKSINYYIGLSKFRALDKYRVEIINPKPISDLRDILLDLSIIPEGWTSYIDGTGTGPFILEDYNKSEVRLSRRRNKKITGSSDLTLEFLHVPVNLDRVNLLRDSKCDLILALKVNGGKGTKAILSMNS
jgi:hypothetical protein